jgi:hypothetical protein
MYRIQKTEKWRRPNKIALQSIIIIIRRRRRRINVYREINNNNNNNNNNNTTFNLECLHPVACVPSRNNTFVYVYVYTG